MMKYLNIRNSKKLFPSLDLKGQRVKIALLNPMRAGAIEKAYLLDTALRQNQGRNKEEMQHLNFQHAH